VQKNQAYLTVILLSRVITRLGSLPALNPKVIEGLFATDLAFLQDLYNRINRLEPQTIVCPHCQQEFSVNSQEAEEGLPAGGSLATPSVN
jgi:hypothetical protein